ncbi:MAG TPA: DNA-binding protein [Burkholderiaceae bacterium]|nr:DNA-binding protein [Burkholderiaceae bacterium]
MNDANLPGLTAEIEALKERIADTRTLYREVCALLFFRHGITPTAHRLYQLVRRGSMGTPAEVLRVFWQELRERSRVRLDHPDLPMDLRTLGGELMAQLWTRAQTAAAADLEFLRQEARDAAESARQQAETAQGELASLRIRVPQLQAAFDAAIQRELESVRELATNQGRIASMTDLLRETAQEMQRLRQELAVAQRDVARAVGEANALRVQLGLVKRRGRRSEPAGAAQAAQPAQDDLALDPEPPGQDQG